MQLEAGDSGPSFQLMREALEARNWTFLFDCSRSHLNLSSESSLPYVYLGIAAARLGWNAELCEGILYGWRDLPDPTDLAKQAAAVCGTLGLPQFTLAFFGILQILSQRPAHGGADRPELVESFRGFLAAANIEPGCRGGFRQLLLPYYFALLIREVAERIPSHPDSLDRYY